MGSLLVQSWTWIEHKRPTSWKRLIEAGLDRFERFQLPEPATVSEAAQPRSAKP